MSAEDFSAILLSLRVATVATLFSLPIGVLAALYLARSRSALKPFVDALVHLPLVLPPVVTGYALLLLFGLKGPLGAFLAEKFGIVFAFRWTGAALASGVMGFPLLVRSIRLSIEAVDRRLEAAAATLGANAVMVFAMVTLPLILPGLIAGALLGFARSLGEFGATITFVSNIPGESRTLPTAIYALTQVPGGEREALLLSLIALALGFVLLILADWLGRVLSRRLGAL